MSHSERLFSTRAPGHPFSGRTFRFPFPKESRMPPSSLLPKQTRFRAAVRISAVAVGLSGLAAQAAQVTDKVHGNLIQFTENGGWCWYQDERVVVDPKRGEMAISALANRYGVGGSPRDGDVDVVRFDLKTRQSERNTLREALLSYGGGGRP
jgi:hypothetical protein